MNKLKELIQRVGVFDAKKFLEEEAQVKAPAQLVEKKRHVDVLHEMNKQQKVSEQSMIIVNRKLNYIYQY